MAGICWSIAGRARRGDRRGLAAHVGEAVEFAVRAASPALLTTLIPGLARAALELGDVDAGVRLCGAGRDVHSWRHALTDRLSSRTPLLITSPDDEQFWPGQSDELAGLLTAPHEVVRITRAEGANLHCQPLGRRLTARRMFGWLEARLLTRRGVPPTPTSGREPRC